MSKNNRRRNKRGNKAVSPVLAVLMMVAVAVAASLVAYAWVMNYLAFTTVKTGKAVQIQSVGFIGTDLMVYVQNVGQGAVQLDPAQSVYINGILTPSQIDSTKRTLTEGETATITVAAQGSLAGQRTTIRIVTLEGTFTELSLTTSLESQVQYSLIMYVFGNGYVAPGNTTHASGSSVNLEAIHAAGWSFAGWSRDASGTTNTTITMDGPKAVTATFAQDVYTLTVTTVGSGTINRNDSGPYNYGDWIQLTAVPDPGWAFSGWSGDLTGSTNPGSITMNSNKTVTATFTLNQGIFADGFESGDLSAWTSTALNRATIAADKSFAHHGIYGAKVSGLYNAGEYAWVVKTFTAVSTVYSRHYTRLSSVPANIIVFAVMSRSGGHNLFALYNPSTNKWGLYNYVASEYYWESGTSTIAANTWYCLEFRVTISSTAGVCQLWIDGTKKVDVSSKNTGTTNVDRIYVGGYLFANEAAERIVYHDCVVISDAYIGPEV